MRPLEGETLETDRLDRSERIDPRRLLTLRAVARTGSMAAAARELGWTQPAVSQQMVELERQVGAQILHRTSRGVSLTTAGQALVRHADAIASHLSAAVEEASVPGPQAAPRLTIAAYPSAGKTLVMPALAALARHRPELAVSLVVAEPAEATELLRSGAADVSIVFDYRKGQRRPEFEAHTLLIEPMVAIVAATDPLASDPNASIAALSGARWIAGCERCREHLLDVCAAAGFEPDIRHNLDDFVLLQHIVAAGLGVALIPSLAFQTFRHPQIAVLRSPEFGTREISCLTQDEAAAIPTVAAVLASLRDAADNLPVASPIG